MKSFLKLVLAMLAALLLFTFILFLIVMFSGTAEVPIVRNNSYLVINYGGPLLEYPPEMGLEQRLLQDDVETLHRVLENLTKAAVDDRITGVIFKINGHGAGYGMQAEIHEAIQQVQAAGKPVFAFATILTPRSYLLATACDSIFMPPSGYFNFVGLTTERSYVKGMMDKLGIRANIHRIKDYKTVPEKFSRKNMSPAAREMANWLLDERWDYFTATLKANRGISVNEIRKAMNQVMLLPEDAQSAGFIDDVCYWPEIEARLKPADSDKFRTVTSKEYGDIKPDEVGISGKNKIAVVHAQGTIMGQKSGTNPMLGVTMGYESVIADLKAAEKAKNVKAIVFRINSGGGDAMTSDLIAHQIELTSQKKPIVVSMVDMAASGGYLIAYRANKLVADETSLTGSIGLFSGKFNFKGFYKKIGITKDFATKGPMGLFYSDYFDFTPRQWNRLRKYHQAGFDDWIADVARYRHMDIEKVRSLAEGRVWTGRQAKNNGLIDETGGLNTAIRLAKELANLPAEEPVSLVHYPRERTLTELILEDGLSGIDTANWLMFKYLHLELPQTVEYLSDVRWYAWDPMLSE